MVRHEFHALVDEAKKEIQEISPADLKKMQQSGDDFILVDVREKDEAAKGMIPSAVNVTRGTLELNIDQVTTDKNKKIVLYCGGGSRDRKSTRLNSSHRCISYAVFCLKKKKKDSKQT